MVCGCRRGDRHGAGARAAHAAASRAVAVLKWQARSGLPQCATASRPQQPPAVRRRPCSRALPPPPSARLCSPAAAAPGQQLASTAGAHNGSLWLALEFSPPPAPLLPRSKVGGVAGRAWEAWEPQSSNCRHLAPAPPPVAWRWAECGAAACSPCSMPSFEAGASAPSPLYDAAEAGDVERLRAAIAAHPEQLDMLDAGSGCPPLAAAAAGGHIACVGVLLAAGAAVDAPGVNCNSPLTIAASAGRELAVERLIQAGAIERRRATAGAPWRPH